MRLDVAPDRAGVIARVDARSIGLALTRLGGGRRHPRDAIDPAVGLTDMRGVGDAVGRTGPSRWFTRDPRPMRKWRRRRFSAP